jgi:hypothetical protein
MAIVASSPAFKSTIQLVATNGKSMPVNLSLTAGTYDEAVTAVLAFLTDLAGVSAGNVKSYTITATAIQDALALPTDQDAEYGEAATVTGKMEGNPLKPWTLKIPMPKAGIFVATAGENRDVVDITDAALIAYLANFTSTGDVATVSDGEFIDPLLVSNGRRVN